MMALSALCRRRGDPEIARRAIGHAQCNDASWHGVFGGLYLPHLREAVWLNLARAERELRSGESLTAEILDLDRDGRNEVWVHSSQFSALVSPAQGGTIVEYTMFKDGINYADVLTRRREAYHYAPAKPEAGSHDDDDGIASIHHLEESMLLKEPPPIDAHDRAITVDSIRADGSFEVVGDDLIILRGEGVEKRIRFSAAGEIHVSWKWTVSEAFTTEISSTRPLEIEASPEAERTAEKVETVAKSEKGFDRTVQGEAVTLRWNATAGAAELRIRPY
jgi:hypothetical protein